jgi:DNA-binding response OmpR family regulator
MEKTKAKILFVEDDISLGMVVKDYLTISKFEVILCDNGISAWETFPHHQFDLCILDVMLPKMDGFALAESIRKINEQIPIIFLTAKASFDDKIAGFKTGADDYITKPFNIEELVYRIEVFLKRTKSGSVPKDYYELGNYFFDYHNLSLTIKGKTKKLTQKEADILHLLCIHSGTVIKREEVLNKIWGDDDYFLGRSLDVFISKLRKYLKDDSNIKIQNYHSVGFKLCIEK